MTLEWRHDGNGHSGSAPWWTAEKPDIGRIERYATPCFPGISSYPAETSGGRPNRPAWVAIDTDDSSDEEQDLEAHVHDSSPAWHCLSCGKLNVVAPFRSGWSWTCSCGVSVPLVRTIHFFSADACACRLSGERGISNLWLLMRYGTPMDLRLRSRFRTRKVISSILAQQARRAKNTLRINLLGRTFFCNIYRLRNNTW